MPDFHALHRRTGELLAEQLPALDLADATDDDLLDQIRHFAVTRDTLATLTGRLIAELLSRGKSIRDIAEVTGFPKSTVDRWAAPYTRGEA